MVGIELPMNHDPIEIDNESFTVDAGVIAEKLGIEPEKVLDGIRNGSITSLCERGVDDDVGRFRLTFSRGNRRLRLIVDTRGVVVQISTLDFGDRPIRASVRRLKLR